MKDLTGPIEKVVVIPIGMDCRELKFRIRDAASGGFVMCTPKEMQSHAEHLKDNDNEYS